MAAKTYRGSCHCGAIPFEAELDLANGTHKCNCSNCTKARSWFAPTAVDKVKLLQGAENQTEYTWIPPGKAASYLQFRFCKTCGVRTFGESVDHKFAFVNVAALDDVDRDELAAAPQKFADGRHDKFNESPADTRFL